MLVTMDRTAMTPMILSVPEGDDKPLKYPLMFSICDVVLINKTDVMPYFDFDMDKCVANIHMRNPEALIIPICARTGQGMELGEVSGIVDYYLLDCWKWASARSDLLKGCEMDIQVLPAVTRCRNCGRTYRTVDHGRECPNCGSVDTYLLRGNEINIKDMAGM